MKYVILILMLIVILGCDQSFRSPFYKKAMAGEKLIDSVKEKTKLTAYVMSGTNWLFSVLVIGAVSGLALFLALKIKEGLAITVSCVAGAALVVAFARWGWLIGLLFVVVSFVLTILTILKLKTFKDIGTYAVQYAEGLKENLAPGALEKFHKIVKQPPAVKKGISTIRRKNGSS